MKKLLYIGNKLSQHGSTATTIETLGHFLEQEGYTVYYASSKKNIILRMLDMVFTTLKYSREVDYVLIDVYSTLNFWYALIISQLCRVLHLKYIAKLHGGALPQRLKTSPFLCSLIFKNAYSITAPSPYLLHSFSVYSDKNLVYIPNAIEIKSYPFTDRETVVPKLLWVRSFASIYNPKMAIEVLSLLKRDFPDASLCMVGPDKENCMEECKAYAAALHVSVRFMGKLSKEAWSSLSENYTVFINTTHFDNTPVSVIEAMALGLPVVSTNVGGLPYLIEDGQNGLLVSDGDAEGMRGKITKLLVDSKLRQTIVYTARDRVEAYDWKVVKNKWSAVLK